MKKNVVILVVLAVLCSLYIAFLIFLQRDYHPTEGYLIVSNLGGFYCNASVCHYEEVKEINLENKKVDTYQNNKYIGTFELQYLSKWNFLEDKKWKQVSGDFLGIDVSLNAKVRDFSYQDFTDEDYQTIRNVLARHQISSYQHLDNTEVLVLDLDGNGVDDKIFSVSNQTEEGDETLYFSTLFLLLNHKVVEVFFDTTQDIFSIPFYHVFSILQIDDDKKPYFIFNQLYYDAMGSTETMLYQLDGKKMKELVREHTK